MTANIQRDEQQRRQKLVWGELQKRAAFANANEDYYVVDFTQRPPRKFVHTEGIRVYEEGLIEVDPPVMRNPKLRDYLWRTFGLNFELVSNCPGIEFSLDGKSIPKSTIATEIVLLDWTSMRAFALYERGYGRLRGIHLACPGAIPTSLASIVVDKPDRKRIKELKKINEDTINLLLTTYSLHARNVGVNNRAVRAVRDAAMSAIMHGAPVDVSALDADQMAAIGSYFSPSAIKDTFEQRVRITEKHHYINFTSKE